MQSSLISQLNSFKKFILLTFLSIFLPGCATHKQVPDPQDPLEGLNRATYQFNDKVDKIVIKPVAQLYHDATPWPIRKGVSNFFSNLGELPTMANDALQGEPRYVLNDFWRLVLNSSVGVGGIFDVATDAGLEKRYNDFGITLARWGVTTAPYIVIPFIGPSTIRDGLALAVDYEFFTVWPYIHNISLRNSLFALDVISLRASLLEAESVMDQAALDPYVFIRNAYLQKRQSLIATSGSVATAENAQSITQPLRDDELDFALGNDADANNQ